MVISALFVALIYGSSSTFYIYALPPAPGFDSAKDCSFDNRTKNIDCCWWESVPPGTGNPLEGGDSARGQGVLPQEGVLDQLPADQGAAELPATEETQPAIVEEEPVPPCPEGQILNEETGLCVLEESEAAEKLEQTESEDSGTEEENSNN